jgi:hypothetical protein
MRDDTVRKGGFLHCPVERKELEICSITQYAIHRQRRKFQMVVGIITGCGEVMSSG